MLYKNETGLTTRSRGRRQAAPLNATVRRQRHNHKQERDKA